MVQCLRICLSMQGTPLRSLGREVPTYLGGSQAHKPRQLKPRHLESMLCNRRSITMRRPHTTTGEQRELGRNPESRDKDLGSHQ